MSATIDDQYIAHWLLGNPDFFVRQAELLTNINITSPYHHRAISLQERQLEVMREKNRGLELRLTELQRHAKENDHTLSRLHQLATALLRQPYPGTELICQLLCQIFDLPCVVLRQWTDTTQTTTISFQQQIDALITPLCGTETNPLCNEVRAWLAPHPIASIALIPLRTWTATRLSPHDTHHTQPHTAGILVLGDNDAQRFNAHIGTTYLEQIGALISAALARSDV
ncbi:MAG: DUF484 family protein [Ottowia sp.]|nr:DUF484 family protein [Ottowia sp.]